MKTYYIKCRKDTENIEPKIVRTKRNRLIMQSKCSVCGIKKSRFIKEQEAKGLLSNLGIKTPLSEIPLLNVLFWIRCIKNEQNYECNVDFNKKDPKFKVGDHVRISKYKSIFAKRYTPNWSEEVLVISKIKNTVPWTYAISDLNGEEIIGSFYENDLQKTSKKQFRIEKVLKREGDKLYVKWKEYDNRLNSWINKKYLL